MIPVLINVPYAGVEERLRKNLGREYFRYRKASKRGEITDLVQDEVSKGERFIVLSCGDSGLREALGAPVDIKDITWALTGGGTACNTFRNIGGKNSSLYSLYETIREIGEGKPTFAAIIPTDLLRISFDQGKSVYASSSFSLGCTARACDQAEKSAEKNTFLRRLLGKKPVYMLESFKVMMNYELLSLNLDYEFKDRRKESRELNEVFALAVSNGPYFATMKNWIPDSCPYDEMMEAMTFGRMGLSNMLNLVCRMAFWSGNAHVGQEEDKTGFNAYGVSLRKGLKSLSIRFISTPSSSCSIIEADGSTFQIEMPEEPILVDIVPKATNFLYYPMKRKENPNPVEWK